MLKVTACIAACVLVSTISLAAAGEVLWGGVGGAYFLASPGVLWVELEKVDLNLTQGETIMQAILLGPDRRVIDVQLLPDDGRARGSGPGSVQRVRLTTEVPRKGVYALNVTVSNDRYGETTAWRLRTNCPRYVIETSGAHRDAPHEEPLRLHAPEAAGDICFLPSRGRFTIDATGLDAGAQISVYDAQGVLAGKLEASEKGHMKGAFDSPVIDPAKPWRVSLPKFQGVLNIDGATRWSSSDVFEHMSLWTPDRESWFPLAAFRWLLTPYNRLVYAEAGSEGSTTFEVHNNGLEETAVSLELEFDGKGEWTAELSAGEVVLPPKGSAEVSVRYRAPLEGERWICHIRATPSAYPEFTTYSTFELRLGQAPANQPIDPPIVITPYRHENQLFGYNPEYTLANEVYFDPENRAVVFSEEDVWRDGAWTNAAAPKGFNRVSPKAAFDNDNWLYAIGRLHGRTALAYSADGARTFKAATVDGDGAYDIEQFSGHNVPDGPPPFVRYTQTHRDPDLIWRRLNDLELFLPEKTDDGAIEIPPPVLITKDCIGYSGHSGIPSTVVSGNGTVHVVWAEATDPDEDVPGVPTFAATYDRATRTLTDPALIGYGPPANNIHNTPCITIDSQGYLHVLIGTHGRTFQYARSIEPNNAAAGWTPAEDLGDDLRQTYVGMVCSPDDTLHVVFRLWQWDTDYFPAGNYACLAYMSKKPGQPWTAPRRLVVPPFSSYSVFRHRLTIDRNGGLFLAYNTWTTYWFYRNDHRGERKALLTSNDGGATWKLAEMSDIVPRQQE